MGVRQAAGAVLRAATGLAETTTGIVCSRGAILTILTPLSFTLLAGEGPLMVKRVLRGFGHIVHPTSDDYDNDGVQDLLATDFPNVHLISGLNGAVLRTYEREPDGDNTFGAALESMPDSDGDSLRDFVIGDPFKNANGHDRGGVAYGVQSGGPDGPIGTANLLFRLEGGPDSGALGYYLGATRSSILVSWADAGRVIVVDAVTGSVRARLENSGVGSLGNSLAGIGDINGDGVEELAIGGRSVLHPSVASVFVFDGGVTTSGPGFTNIAFLPSGTLLAEITSSKGLPLGDHGGQGDRELIVNLGDPRPDNEVKERLIVVGTPGANSYQGGLAAYLIAEAADRTFSVTEVAAFRAYEPDKEFGRDVSNVGDVTRDGVNDLAVLSSEFQDEDGKRVGRILIIDGAGLLDGFTLTNDVIQDVRGTPSEIFHGGMRDLGDYDGDGLRELLVTEEGAGDGIQIFSVDPGAVPVPDCNRNGIRDSQDLEGGISQDCNRNWIPDECDLIPSAPAFAAGPKFAAGDGPVSFVIADLGGKGGLDIAAANTFSHDVSVLLDVFNDLGSPQTRFRVGANPSWIAAGDVDGNGIIDLITSNGLSDSVSVLVGSGNGAFSPAESFQTGDAPNHVVVVDMDDDGFLDLVTANRDSNDLSELRGNGDGTFRAPRSLAAGWGPFFVAVQDINGDGVLDLTVANVVGNDISVLLGSGAGTFREPVKYTTGDNPGTVLVVDLDSDGYLDLLAANRGSRSVSVFRGRGDGTFEQAMNFKAGFVPAGVAVADINRDGRLDVVTANRDASTVSVLLGTGGGSLLLVREFLAGPGPSAVATVDFDGDADLDLLIANVHGQFLSAFINHTAPPVSTDGNRNDIPDECDEGVQIPGDCTQDGTMDLADGVRILTVLFRGEPPLFPCGDGLPTDPGNLALLDWQPDGAVDLSDAVALFQYLFMGSEAPALAAGAGENVCVPILGCPDNPGCE